MAVCKLKTVASPKWLKTKHVNFITTGALLPQQHQNNAALWFLQKLFTAFNSTTCATSFYSVWCCQLFLQVRFCACPPIQVNVLRSISYLHWPLNWHLCCRQSYHLHSKCVLFNILRKLYMIMLSDRFYDEFRNLTIVYIFSLSDLGPNLYRH